MSFPPRDALKEAHRDVEGQQLSAGVFLKVSHCTERGGTSVRICSQLAKHARQDLETQQRSTVEL